MLGRWSTLKYKSVRRWYYLCFEFLWWWLFSKKDSEGNWSTIAKSADFDNRIIVDFDVNSNGDVYLANSTYIMKKKENETNWVVFATNGIDNGIYIPNMHSANPNPNAVKIHKDQIYVLGQYHLMSKKIE